jgi:PIN domain nuclease of toxin-antitoxin system
MMKILFDSHALVWFLTGHARFSRRARSVVEKPDSILCVSAVSAWEIANKVRLGKWPEAAQLAETFMSILDEFSFQPLAVTIEHARLAGSLPGHHRDPFDRMLAAQSQIEEVPLVTADPVFGAFGTRVLW